MTSKRLTPKSKTTHSPDRASATSRSAMTMKCPTCGKSTVYSNENPCRPFCSRNCKVSDLAAWASDEYRVPETKQIDRPTGDGFDTHQNGDNDYEFTNRQDENDQE